jgi:transposase-like protein
MTLKKKIVGLKLAGASASELGLKYKVNPNLIHKWAKAPELKAKAPAARPKGRPAGMSSGDLDRRRSKAMADVANGMDAREAAAKHGVDATTVRKWVREEKHERTANPAHKLADAMLASIRPMLVAGISELVDLAVKQRVEEVISTLLARRAA